MSPRRLAPAALLLLLLPAFAVAADADPLAAQAVASGKPLVVDFGKGQCTQCILQGEAIEAVQKKIGDKVGFRFVHAIKEAELTGRYRVFLIPTLVFLDAQGREVDRNVGLLDENALAARFKLLGWVR